MKNIVLLFLVLSSCSSAVLPFNGVVKSSTVILDTNPPMQCVMIDNWIKGDKERCWCTFGPMVVPSKVVKGPMVVTGFLLAPNEYCSKGFVLPKQNNDEKL